jgi:LysM repeat protein
MLLKLHKTGVVLAGLVFSGMASGCAYQLPSFVMPGSGTPSTPVPRAELKPKTQMPDSQRLGATDVTPAGGVPYKAPPPQLVAKPGEKIITISPDDTLLSLSRSTGVPVTLLMSSNNLSTLTLTPGQELRIPSINARPSINAQRDPPPKR